MHGHEGVAFHHAPNIPEHYPQEHLKATTGKQPVPVPKRWALALRCLQLLVRLTKSDWADKAAIHNVRNKHVRGMRCHVSMFEV
jgi:hypothetical protein